MHYDARVLNSLDKGHLDTIKKEKLPLLIAFPINASTATLAFYQSH